jgi:hypothetical protein
MVRTEGHRGESARHQLAVNGPGAVLAQSAVLLQCAAHHEHQILHCCLGARRA